jgi:glycosyltransferase involved in cell wall biosynthesis
MLSVFILTKNEQADLPGCLDSVSWCDDIHVIDSGSTDQTVEIARQSGAKVKVNPFMSFGHQRNWALDNCEAKNDWVLFLDADERSTPAFFEALIKATSSASPSISGFYCCWKTFLDGRWLKRSDNFPKWQFRMLRRGCARFADSGHGQKEGVMEGSIAYIPEPYLHFAFSKGWGDWVDKHKIYAKKDALAIHGQPLSLRDLLSRHGSRRNTAVKRLVRIIPGWHLVRFAYSYVLKGGYLEGAQGLEYCRRMMWYERQIQKEISALHDMN